MARCPFINPDFDLEIHEPCPVCGMTGEWCDDASKCVGEGTGAGADLKEILREALASDVGQPRSPSDA
jgi:hypothetical protein